MKLTIFNLIRGALLRLVALLPPVCGALLILLLLGVAQAFAGYQPDLLVRLASEGDFAYLGSGVFETTALLQSRSQASFPGTPASFRVLLKNAGDFPDSFLVRGDGPVNGATLRFLDQAGVDRSAALSTGFATPTLAPGESIAFLVQVTPVVFQLGASFRVSVTAASVADPGKTDQVKTETVACGSTAAVVVSTPPDGLGFPGGVVNYSYTVTNVGNANNSFTLAASSAAGWPCAIYADDGAGGGVAGDAVRQGSESTPCTSTGILPPGASYRFFVAVTIPAASGDGSHADTQTLASGEGASGADLVTTSAVTAAISVAESVRNLTAGGAFAPSANALPGETLEYRMAVTNSGQASATSVDVRSAVPSNTVIVPASLRIGSAPVGDGEACAAALCGWVVQTNGNIVAHLGQGATETAGGSLQPGRTLYVFFRVRVE
jgi:uncharacterized repeat protein (TIGR01451 family)